MLIFSANIWGMHTPFWRKSFEGGGQLIHTWGGASNIGLQLIGGETSLKGLKTTNQIYKFSIHLFAGFSIAMCECRRVRILHLLHRFLHLFCREIRGVASRIVVYNPSSPWWEIAYLPEHWAPIYLSAAMSQISNFKFQTNTVVCSDMAMMFTCLNLFQTSLRRMNKTMHSIHKTRLGQWSTVIYSLHHLHLHGVFFPNFLH